MKIPRHWAKVEEKFTASEDIEYALRVWGVSSVSPADAEADARRRMQALLTRMRDGYHPDGNLYAYRQCVLREQLVEEILGESAQPAAMVTRNRYGSLVLNTARVLFLDVDLPPDGLLRRLRAVLFQGGRTLEQEILSRIKLALQTREGEGFRLYRTARGFRVLGTTAFYEPRSEVTKALMTAVGADRAYANLCRVQDCFRARLTPKPWRIGLPQPKVSFPLEDASRARLETWLAGYEQKRQAWSVCRLVEAIGPDATRPEIRAIVEHHDDACGVASRLPLA